MSYPNGRSLLLLVPALIAGTAAVAVAARIDALVVRSVLQAIAVAAFLAIAWYVGLSERGGGEEARIVEISSALATALTADRRKPTFDRDTGLHANWYFRLRAEEEIARAIRYSQPLSLLCLTGSPATLRTPRLALKRWLREVDFAGDLGDVIAVLLPNTSRDGAATLAERIEAHVPGIAIRVVEHPADGTTLAQLLGDTEWHVSDQFAAA
jgi:GGDEF domain-containing protein